MYKYSVITPINMYAVVFVIVFRENGFNSYVRNSSVTVIRYVISVSIIVNPYLNMEFNSNLL